MRRSEKERGIIARLLDTLPQQGQVNWIGLRPGHRMPVETVAAVDAEPGVGLVGDRFRGRANSKRQVTLIQAEHLPAIAQFTGGDELDPARLRRNLVVEGINLLALKGKRFQVGEAILEWSGLCHPCSRMEEELGPGGYNAMRGHGGITARVLEAGRIEVGSPVRLLSDDEVADPAPQN